MTDSKITIITCTLNSEKYLSDCLESVKKQTYRNFEHIFIDGESSDATIEIINKYYREPIIKRRKPAGIYDALNLGLEAATGEVIGLLHSDDVFYDERCLERIAAAFRADNMTAYYCSKMAIYDEELKEPFAVLGARPHKQTLRDQLYSSTYFAHPTYYLRKELIKKIDGYNTAYKIAADIDWLYRLEKLDLPFYFDPHPLIKFRSSGRSAKKYFLALKEEFTIRRRLEGLSFALALIYSYHLVRRSARFILEQFGLNKAINLSRQLILKLRNEGVDDKLS